jgi:hypothetical protein
MFALAHCEIVIMQQYGLWHAFVHDHHAWAASSTAGDSTNRHHPHLPPMMSVT